MNYLPTAILFTSHHVSINSAASGWVLDELEKFTSHHVSINS